MRQKSGEEIRQKSEKGNSARENPPKVEVVKFSILLWAILLTAVATGQAYICTDTCIDISIHTV